MSRARKILDEMDARHPLSVEKAIDTINKSKREQKAKSDTLDKAWGVARDHDGRVKPIPRQCQYGGCEELGADCPNCEGSKIS